MVSVGFGSIVVGAIFGTVAGYAIEAVAGLTRAEAPAETVPLKAE